ncbi:unnamed protein product, partial [Hapterophycus canaliculatus]
CFLNGRQIEYLVSQGCVQILSDLLSESSMVMMALEGIERVLSVGDLRVAGAYTNPYACLLTPEKIQALETHKNSAVAKRWVFRSVFPLV